MISRILVEFGETDLSRYAFLKVDSRITLYARNANLDIGEEDKKYTYGEKLDKLVEKACHEKNSLSVKCFDEN